MKLCVRRWIEHDFPACNHYDVPGSKLENEKLGCTFCNIAAGKSEPLLYEDEHCAIFAASRQRAKAYYQCVPKRHIRDIHHLRPHASDDGLWDMKAEHLDDATELVTNNDLHADLRLVEHMARVSLHFMQEKHPENEDGYRQGFHEPPFNTKYHLHMHCLVLPLTDKKHRYSCDKHLVRVDSVLKKLQSGISIVERQKREADARILWTI